MTKYLDDCEYVHLAVEKSIEARLYNRKPFDTVYHREKHLKHDSVLSISLVKEMNGEVGSPHIRARKVLLGSKKEQGTKYSTDKARVLFLKRENLKLFRRQFYTSFCDAEYCRVVSATQMGSLSEAELACKTNPEALISAPIFIKSVSVRPKSYYKPRISKNFEQNLQNTNKLRLQ